MRLINFYASIILFSSFYITCCKTSLVGWILGRDSSPFSILGSEKQFDKLMSQTAVESQPEEEKDAHLTTTSLIPFELSVADEKFIADAQKYTDLALSELDLCQHRLILQLKQDCNDLTEDQLSKLGVNLLNCQSQLEGRRVYPCTSAMSLKECTREMDPDTWNAYHILSNRARSVCYGARQQQFRALTQMTVNKLVASSSQQLGFIRELKAEQEELGLLAADTLGSIAKGQEKLMEQQNHLKASQQYATVQISNTMRELSKERAAAFATQRQLSAISDSLKLTLNQAAQMAVEQENERKAAQQHLLESLNNIEGHVGEFWNQLERSVAKLLAQQEHASTLQSETVETLQKLNATFQFLLTVTENSREQLNWIQSLVANTEKKLGKLSTWVLHISYFFLGMLLLAFVQAPAYTRWIFLLIVPINLTMDLQKGMAMDVPALAVLLLMLTFLYKFFLFIKSRCALSSNFEDKVQPIAYKTSTPERKLWNDEDLEKTVDDTITGVTLLNGTLLDGTFREEKSRSSTPLPTPAWDVSLLVAQQQHPCVRSILQDSRLEDASFSNSISRRSPRSKTSNSFREQSPSHSIISNTSVNQSRRFSPPPSSVKNTSMNQSRSGTPKTPRRVCAGKCVDGTNCRNATSKDSDFCWKHKPQ